MSKHTPHLYALTPITDTEGLEDGKYDLIYRRNYHRVIYPHTFQGGFWVDLPDEFEEAVYLRPLPEGMVAVSEEELKRFANSIKMLPLTCFNEPKLSEIVNKFITTKLAQMGE